MSPKSSVSTISYGYGSHASLSSYGSYALPLQYYGFYAYYIAFISRLYQLLFLLIFLLLFLLHHDSFQALSRPAVHLWINLWFRDLAHQCSFLVCILLGWQPSLAPRRGLEFLLPLKCVYVVAIRIWTFQFSYRTFAMLGLDTTSSSRLDAALSSI